jgi:hypothetical protein
LKKYIIFGYDSYYPSGGLNDIIGQEDTLEAAIKVCKRENYNWMQIVNRDDWKICWESA